MQLLQELEKLSLTPDFMTEAQANQVIQLVNDKLAAALKPHIIDILWKQEGEYGVILHPRPTMSFERSSRGGALPFEIRRGSEERLGIWAWLYEHGKPVWIEGIRTADLSRPIENRATGDLIDPGYLRIFRETDSLLALPLVTRNIAWGVYSIELPTSGRLRPATLNQMKHLTSAIARIIWKVETLSHNLDQTSRAIRLFMESIRDLPFEDQEGYKSGFIARPFDSGFRVFEDCISSFLLEKGIKAECFKHTPGRGYVLDEITRLIQSSHFGIADITGSNPNVMTEVGMMLSQRKRFILLRRHDDQGEIPFNLASFNVHHYRVDDRTMQVLQPGTQRFENVENVLSAFIGELESDPGFRNAKEFRRLS